MRWGFSQTTTAKGEGMKNITARRDELCDKHLSIVNKAYSEIEKANMPTILCEQSFKAGFNLGIAELRPEIDDLLRALTIYSHDHSRIEDTKIAELALTKFKEFMGDGE